MYVYVTRGTILTLKLLENLDLQLFICAGCLCRGDTLCISVYSTCMYKVFFEDYNVIT